MGVPRKDGESNHEALVREIKEEMAWDIFVGRKLGSVDYEYPDFTVTLTAYLCKGSDEAFKLLEHLNYKWLVKGELGTLKWTDADRMLIEKVL